jgi:hypothetical protein
VKRNLLLLVAAAALMAVVPAYAHHSFAATYFEDKTQSIEGDLVQFLFRNPHSFVHVEAKDEKGEVIRWSVEWGRLRMRTISRPKDGWKWGGTFD